jgi:calcineurin-like phosphoesterase family protein
VNDIKILCVADEVDLLVYSSSIRDRFGDVDLILSAGDLPDEYLGFIASMLNRPIISVAGNHDPDDRAERSPLHSASSSDFGSGASRYSLGRLAFRIRKEAGISVLGLPGSMLYNGGPNQFSDFSMKMHLFALVPRLLVMRLLTGRGVDIILTHAPPRGIHDAKDRCHQGFSSFRWLINLAAPTYFVHGHVHVYDSRELREQKIGATTVVNVYGHRVLSLSKENLR